jgi:hypothetical protein
MRSRNLVLAAIFIVGFGCFAFAQLVSQGTIRGIVEDETGARLPGVTVTARSTALVSDRVYVTGDTGIFRLDALPLGTYEITLELQGFSTIKRGGIIVSPKKVVSLTFAMKLAAVEEVITVTAESPTVDTKTTTSKQDYTAEFLNDIPEPRGTGSDILAMSPTGTASSFAGGGNTGVSWQIDGVDTSDPDMGTQFPFINIDYIQETEIITWGAMPEFGKFSTAIFNVVTKSGGTEYHGEGNFFFRRQSFFGENHKKVQEQFPSFSITPFELKKYYDFSFNIGGPIKKNKVHFFLSFYQLYNDRIPAGNVEVGTDHSRRGVEKLTFQLGDKDRINAAFMFDNYPVGGRAPAGTLDPNAYCEEPSWTFNPIATWQHVFNQNTLLEVRFMGYYGYYDLVPRNTLPCIYDWATGELSQSYWYYMHNGRGSSEVHADLSYFADQWAGTHDFKVGVHFQDGYAHTIFRYGVNEFGTPAYYYGWEGEIIEGKTGNPWDLTHYYQPLTIYAQDSWVIGDRLTLNGGVRIDKTTGGRRGGTDWIHYTDISPRIGASYEITPDGKTVVRAAYGRYYELPHTGTYIFKDLPATSYFTVDAPGVWDIYSVDDPASTLNIDPDLKNHYSDMFTVGFERELMPDLSVSIQYNHREDKQVFGGENRTALWAPFTATDTVTGNTFTMYYQTNLGENDKWLINNDQLHMKYNGMDLIVRKRFSNNWQMMASFTYQLSKGNYDLGYGPGGWWGSAIDMGADPNFFVNGEGKAGGRYSPMPYIFKLQGSYRFEKPLDFLIGWTYEYVRQYYDTRTISVLAPNDKRYTVLAEERGSYQNEPWNLLDIRIEKKFKLPGSLAGIKDAGEIGIMVDIFNVLNDDCITLRRMNTGSLYLTPRRLVTPRGLRIGARWIF